MKSNDHLFTLHVAVRRDTPLVIVDAFDANHQDPETGHHRIDVEVRMDGRVIFPRGATWCAVNRSTCVDGIEAKELVLSLVAMRPGDTDDEYFTSYTPEQIAFAEEFGEAIDVEKQCRYCDPETGEVRKKKTVRVNFNPPRGRRAIRPQADPRPVLGDARKSKKTITTRS